MRRVRFFLLILVTLTAGSVHYRSAAAFTPTPVPRVILLTPSDGQALQGRARLTGEINGGGVVRIDLSFAYPGQGERNWFFITEIDPTVGERFQVDWDTTLITDGDYDLRLQVEYENGLILNHIIREIRIRNYSVIETLTPAPTLVPAASTRVEPSPSATGVPSSPTPLPSNPASVGRNDVFRYLGYGLIGVLALFALAGVYLGLRRLTGRL